MLLIILMITIINEDDDDLSLAFFVVDGCRTCRLVFGTDGRLSVGPFTFAPTTTTFTRVLLHSRLVRNLYVGVLWFDGADVWVSCRRLFVFVDVDMYCVSGIYRRFYVFCGCIGSGIDSDVQVCWIGPCILLDTWAPAQGGRVGKRPPWKKSGWAMPTLEIPTTGSWKSPTNAEKPTLSQLTSTPPKAIYKISIITTILLLLGLSPDPQPGLRPWTPVCGVLRAGGWRSPILPLFAVVGLR